jgi:rod shape-determining protein MreB
METSMPTRIADSPLTCVAVGAGESLEEFEAIARRQQLARRSARRPGARSSRMRR